MNDGARVFLGDAYLDRVLSIRCVGDAVHEKLVANKPQLLDALQIFKRETLAQQWFLMQTGIVESRLRQTESDWTLRQLLELIDNTVAIAKLF